MKLNLGGQMAKYSTQHPRLVTALMTAGTIALLLLALLPTLWPGVFSSLNPLKVDTDPENMLPKEEPVRLFHNEMKKEMSLYDMVVVGVVNDKNTEGVFNPASLRNIYELTQFAKSLRWQDPENPDSEMGVIDIDLIAPSTVDTISQGAQPGFVNFDWLMSAPPETAADAIAVRERAQRIPFLDGTLVSDDGKALAIYLPLSSKKLSGRVYEELRAKIATFDGDDEFHITGLPVAEDVFGVEMFKQMAISAPLAMLVVFLLMLFFFRKFILIISPMIVAIASVIITMALLIATGNTVHIMSSMIPIFIMPIAVLNSIHILSEFFDHYQEMKNRKKTIIHVMEKLFLPMLYTSLTTAVGFGSLALVSIPPVQVFGLFISFGVLVSWFLTITFIPAYVMFIKSSSLENFGMAKKSDSHVTSKPLLVRILNRTGAVIYAHSKLCLVTAFVIGCIAAYGISLVRINDNPVKWFASSHPIRVADRVLNSHFGGTYMAYLELEVEKSDQPLEEYIELLRKRIGVRGAELAGTPRAASVFGKLKAEMLKEGKDAPSRKELLNRLEAYADDQLFSQPEEEGDAWDKALDFVMMEGAKSSPFKQPEVLRFIETIQKRLLKTGIVGKSNSLADIVKTVRRELVSGEEKDYRIPDSSAGVAQALLQYQNSHRPQDLWHFVTPNYQKTVLWIQLKSGDNQDMNKVVREIDDFMANAEMPQGVKLRHRWFGLTYINVIWQDKMVAGMLQAFLGSFLIVFLMMTFLYRSALWGTLAMIPLTITIAVIYGIIGFIGKDYDMPVAVLSSMSLGLAVDYAIHFLSRTRMEYPRHGSWEATSPQMFDAPARAIARNAIVAGVGFLPLLAATLVPYKTVGFFIAAILLSAGLATLLILPAFLRIIEKYLFPKTQRCCMICNCGTCIVSAVAIVSVIVMNIYNFLHLGWTTMTLYSLSAILLMVLACYLIGRTKRCRVEFPSNNGGVAEDIND